MGRGHLQALLGAEKEGEGMSDGKCPDLYECRMRPSDWRHFGNALLQTEVKVLKEKLAASEAANATLREALKKMTLPIGSTCSQREFLIDKIAEEALASDSGSKLLSRLRALEAVAAAAKRLNRVSPAIIFAEEKEHADAMFHELRDALAKLGEGGE